MSIVSLEINSFSLTQILNILEGGNRQMLQALGNRSSGKHKAFSYDERYKSKEATRYRLMLRQKVNIAYKSLMISEERRRLYKERTTTKQKTVNVPLTNIRVKPSSGQINVPITGMKNILLGNKFVQVLGDGKPNAVSRSSGTLFKRMGDFPAETQLEQRKLESILPIIRKKDAIEKIESLQDITSSSSRNLATDSNAVNPATLFMSRIGDRTSGDNMDIPKVDSRKKSLESETLWRSAPMIRSQNKVSHASKIYNNVSALFRNGGKKQSRLYKNDQYETHRSSKQELNHEEINKTTLSERQERHRSQRKFLQRIENSASTSNNQVKRIASHPKPDEDRPARKTHDPDTCTSVIGIFHTKLTSPEPPTIYCSSAGKRGSIDTAVAAVINPAEISFQEIDLMDAKIENFPSPDQTSSLFVASKHCNQNESDSSESQLNDLCDRTTLATVGRIEKNNNYLQNNAKTCAAAFQIKDHNITVDNSRKTKDSALIINENKNRDYKEKKACNLTHPEYNEKSPNDFMVTNVMKESPLRYPIRKKTSADVENHQKLQVAIKSLTPVVNGTMKHARVNPTNSHSERDILRRNDSTKSNNDILAAALNSLSPVAKTHNAMPRSSINYPNNILSVDHPVGAEHRNSSSLRGSMDTLAPLRIRGGAALFKEENESDCREKDQRSKRCQGSMDTLKGGICGSPGSITVPNSVIITDDEHQIIKQAQVQPREDRITIQPSSIFQPRIEVDWQQKKQIQKEIFTGTVTKRRSQLKYPILK